MSDGMCALCSTSNHPLLARSLNGYTKCYRRIIGGGLINAGKPSVEAAYLARLVLSAAC